MMIMGATADSADSTGPECLPQKSARISSSLWLACGLIVAIGVLFRIWRIDTLPGIDGDEAWYAVQVQNALDHHTAHWINGNGHPTDLWLAVTLTLAHIVHPNPSFWLLRLPALSSSLILLLLTYCLMRRAWGVSQALLGVTLVSSTPVLLIYSRISWSTSISGLWALLALYFVLQRRHVAGAIAFGLVLWAHPTNVFVLPVLLGPAVVDFLRCRVPPHAVAHPLRRFVMDTVPFGIALLAYVAFITVLAPRLDPQARGTLRFLKTGAEPYGSTHQQVATYPSTSPKAAQRSPQGRLAAMMAERLRMMPSQLVRLPMMYVDYLSGVTAYKSVVSRRLSPTVVWASRLVAMAYLVPLLLVGTRNLKRNRAWTEIALLIGILVGLTLQITVLRSKSFNPEYLRFLTWLAVPSCVGLTILLNACLRNLPTKWQLLPGITLSCLLLLSYQHQFFTRCLRHGGDLHRPGFRTAPEDPKKIAYDMITAAVPSGRKITILAEDWWSYQPLRYLSSQNEYIEVLIWARGMGAGYEPMVSRWSVVPEADNVFGTSFTDGPLTELLRRRHYTPLWTVGGFGGTPVLLIWDMRSWRGRKLD